MPNVKYVFLYLCFKLKNKFTAHTIECRQICISVFILQIRELVHQPHYWMATNMYFWSWRSGTLVNVWFSISLQENTECPRFCQVQSTIFSHKFSPITHNFWEKNIYNFMAEPWAWLYQSYVGSTVRYEVMKLCRSYWVSIRRYHMVIDSLI